MKLKFSKAAWNDGWLALSWIGFAVASVFLTLIALGILEGEAVATWVFVGLLGLTAILFVWRLVWILRLFRIGKQAEGIVDAVSFHRDRGIVKFFFLVGETFVKTKQAIHRTKAANALSPGQKVQVVYLETRPKRALIVALYQA